jgi:threonine dehydratase
MSVTLADVRAARERIAPHIHRTPVLRSSLIDREVNAALFFKCENFQKVGAFKARGACNAVFSLSDAEAERGVVTHSSGNHGAALAWASAKRGVKATVVVPRTAPEAKKRAIDAYGARIIYCEPTIAARETTVAKEIAAHHYTLVHPFDNERVIAGQGTAALELLEDYPDLDMVIAPLGGGGLLSGTAIAAKGLKPAITVYGAEPQGADDGFRSYTSGTRVTEMTPRTVCDGLQTVLSERTFAIIRANVDGIGLASEAGVIAAMRMSWSLLKIIIEPSCAPPLAAIRESTIPVAGKKVGIVLTGGNVDLDRLPWQA